jgi:hypothetical protein
MNRDAPGLIGGEKFHDREQRWDPRASRNQF